MQRLIRVIMLMIMIMCVASFGQKWTENEKENAEHFLKSLNLIIEAHSISNKAGRPMSNEDFKKILSLYQLAFSESKLVLDDVLEKANPELKNNYRMYFQKGIELRIRGWTAMKPYDEIKGSALMDSWGDWFEKNRHNIKIPR